MSKEPHVSKYIDNEERELIEAIEASEYKIGASLLTPERIKELRQAARNTIKKNKIKPSNFDPAKHGFILLDKRYGSVQFFERHVDGLEQGKMNPVRLNVYLSRDGDYVTIWSGLFDPMFTEGALNPPDWWDFDFGETYNEALFKGHICKDSEAEIILNALRYDKYIVSHLRKTDGDKLECVAWKREE